MVWLMLCFDVMQSSGHAWSGLVVSYTVGGCVHLAGMSVARQPM